MHDLLIAFLGSVPGILAVLASAVYNATRFNAINQRFDAVNQRFDDMRELWRAELKRVEEVLDARLKHLEGR
jgi:hypothetical protein